MGRGRATRCLSVDTTRAASSLASGAIWPNDPGGGEKVRSASIIHQHNILPHTAGVSQTFAPDDFFFFSSVCSHTTVCFSANNK